MHSSVETLNKAAALFYLPVCAQTFLPPLPPSPSFPRLIQAPLNNSQTRRSPADEGEEAEILKCVSI